MSVLLVSVIVLSWRCKMKSSINRQWPRTEERVRQYKNGRGYLEAMGYYSVALWPYVYSHNIHHSTHSLNFWNGLFELIVCSIVFVTFPLPPILNSSIIKIRGILNIHVVIFVIFTSPCADPEKCSRGLGVRQLFEYVGGGGRLRHIFGDFIL